MPSQKPSDNDLSGGDMEHHPDLKPETPNPVDAWSQRIVGKPELMALLRHLQMKGPSERRKALAELNHIISKKSSSPESSDFLSFLSKEEHFRLLSQRHPHPDLAKLDSATIQRLHVINQDERRLKRTLWAYALIAPILAFVVFPVIRTQTRPSMGNLTGLSEDPNAFKNDNNLSILKALVPGMRDCHRTKAPTFQGKIIIQIGKGAKDLQVVSAAPLQLSSCIGQVVKSVPYPMKINPEPIEAALWFNIPSTLPLSGRYTSGCIPGTYGGWLHRSLSFNKGNFTEVIELFWDRTCTSRLVTKSATYVYEARPSMLVENQWDIDYHEQGPKPGGQAPTQTYSTLHLTDAGFHLSEVWGRFDPSTPRRRPHRFMEEVLFSRAARTPVPRP